MWFSFEQTLCPWGKPLYKPYRYLPPQQVGCLRLFGLQMGIDFAQFGLESGVVFARTMWVYERIYRFNSKWVRKKEKYANSKWIWRIFEEFFYLLFKRKETIMGKKSVSLLEKIKKK